MKFMRTMCERKLPQNEFIRCFDGGKFEEVSAIGGFAESEVLLPQPVCNFVWRFKFGGRFEIGRAHV